MRRSIIWMLIATLACVLPAGAQTNLQRIPPTAPVLHFAGRIPTGEGVFVEQTRLRRNLATIAALLRVFDAPGARELAKVTIVERVGLAGFDRAGCEE